MSFNSKAMSPDDEQEFSYRGDLSQNSLHHTHPGMSNSFSHGVHTEYSRMEESLRAEDYATYRIIHPLTCDQLSSVAQLSSAPYPEYLLAQTSHYQHLMGQSYGSISSPWPAQEVYHYGMPSVSANFWYTHRLCLYLYGYIYDRPFSSVCGDSNP